MQKTTGLFPWNSVLLLCLLGRTQEIWGEALSLTASIRIQHVTRRHLRRTTYNMTWTSTQYTRTCAGVTRHSVATSKTEVVEEVQNPCGGVAHHNENNSSAAPPSAAFIGTQSSLDHVVSATTHTCASYRRKGPRCPGPRQASASAPAGQHVDEPGTVSAAKVPTTDVFFGSKTSKHRYKPIFMV